MYCFFRHSQNMGLLENMANSVVPPPAVYKGYISPDLTCDATKPSRFARRSAINTLKTLGKIPFGYDPGPLQESKPKKPRKSKLQIFREYIHRCETSHKTSADSIRCELDTQPTDDLKVLKNNPWSREALWK